MNYSTADIREFLMKAFSDEELNTFCFDHFADVYNGFTAGQTKGQRIQLLLEYCLRHDRLANFVAALQQARPEQFAKRFPDGIASVSPESQSPEESPVLAERRAAPAYPSSALLLVGGLVIVILACVAVSLVVPEFRQFLGLDIRTPTRIAVGPTHTATATPRPTVTPTTPSTPTSMPTRTPTPPEEPIRALIESEARAALTRDINLIRSIFAPDAVRINAETGQIRNAYDAYAEIFGTLTFGYTAHGGIDVTLTGDTAAAVSDSCGSFTVNNSGAKVDFGGPQSDRWTFSENANGEWQISSFTFNLLATEPQQRYTFEDNTHGCWLVRIDNDVPQGLTTASTDERAHEDQRALRFDYDTSLTQEHRSQVAHTNMPFAGQASAWIYVPPDAPVDLEAGFFAMELDREPWKYHAPDQLVSLTPGQWTRITWDTNATGWAQPLHLLGIEVRRACGGDHRGYFLIDDVTISSR